MQLANLRNANLYGTKLEYTVLWQADLEGAFLGDVNLEKQSLRGVNLKNTIMLGANLQGAELDGVFLQGAYLTGANLKGATVVVVPGFPKAVFMQEAKLIGTNLGRVNLSAVDLRKAIYSDIDTHPSVCETYQLQSPCPTIFPKGFNPKAAGMIKVHLEDISNLKDRI